MKFLSLLCVHTLSVVMAQVGKANLADHRGVRVTLDKAKIALGAKEDVNLYRTGPQKLAVDAHVTATGNVNVLGDLVVKGKKMLPFDDKVCSAGCTDKIQDSKNWMLTTVDKKIKQALADIAGPITSCKVLKEQKPTAKSGAYDMVTPKGTKYTAYCEMEKAGGGWTRFLQLNGDKKNCKKNFKDIPLSQEIVGDYCHNKEYTFSRSMMLESNHELLFTDEKGRQIWYKFSGCASGQCTCDRVSGDTRDLCFFLATTADYSGGEPLMGGDKFDIFTDAYEWATGKWKNAGDGHCGGTNANAHSQFNCEPHREDNMGQCGQRWHYGSRHDGSGKGGSTCSGTAEGCAWAWYTGLATSWQNCKASSAAWMIKGPAADGQKLRAEVWFR